MPLDAFSRDPFAPEPREEEGERGSGGSGEGLAWSQAARAAAVAALLALAAGAFFVLQPQSVPVAVLVEDTEGNGLASSTVEVLQDGHAVQVLRGSARYALELREGRYVFSASAPGYRGQQKSVEVREGARVRFALEKRLAVSLELGVPAAAFPVNAATPVPVTLRNGGGEDARVALVFEGFDGVALELEPETVEVPAGGQAVATLFVKPLVQKRGLQEGVVRVRFTKEAQKLAYTVAPPARLQPGARVVMEAVAGGQASATARFENRGAVDIVDAAFGVVLEGGQRPDTLFWFSVEPARASISAKEGLDVNLVARVPGTARPGSVRGRVVAQSRVLGKEVAVPFALTVKPAPPPLEITLPTPVHVALDPEQNAFLNEEVVLAVQNVSGLPVHELAVSLQNPARCSYAHLAFQPFSVPVLAPGQKVEVAMQARAPREGARVTDCRLQVAYLDPRTRQVARVEKVLEILKEG